MKPSHILDALKCVLDGLNRYFKLFVLALILGFVFWGSGGTEKEPNLAKIYLKGAIFDSEEVRTQIEKIQGKPSIKGVLLLIDSPGGSVGASIEVANLIKDLRDSIPIVAFVQDVMASGSYYAGMYSDKIIANRGALIGSIGVIYQGVNVQELMAKIGIKPETLQVGEFKNIGTPFRTWSPKEKDFLEKLLRKQYQMFVQDVMEARKLNDSDPRSFAEGKIFTAHEALKLGLIDAIGSQNQAIKELLEITQIQSPIWLERSKTEEWMDRLSQASLSVLTRLLKGQIQ